MALLVFAILDVMCCYFCYFVGTQKGYNGPLCAFAGLFGSFLACLILLLMPDKASDTFNSAAFVIHHLCQTAAHPQLPERPPSAFRPTGRG